MTPIRTLARAGAAVSTALGVHTVINVRLLRRPPAAESGAPPRISVLLPLRDEARRVEPCLRALRVALDRYGPGAELVVLDDQSSDGTAALVRALSRGDARITVRIGAPLPDGWLGKPYACHQLSLAAAPDSAILVFLDADVILSPDGLARAVAQLTETGLSLVSPYPHQRTETFAERLVQPLLQWSWLTFLPLRLAERPNQRSLTAANGQLMAIDAHAYRESGGHTSVRNAVLDDIALLKSLKDSGFRGAVTDGTELASCRMYENWPDLRDGYAKSLWAATGSPAGAAALCAALIAIYVVPPFGWLCRPRDPVLASGVISAIAARTFVARRVGGRMWPDPLTHPASILAFTHLCASSWRGRRRGSLRWKNRPV